MGWCVPVAHLLAEGRDAGVPGEREEQQTRGLQHTARARIAAVSRDASTSPEPSTITTTAASTARTTATMMRVTSADFWTPV